MTEPKQEYIDELREQLTQEEEICEDCSDKGSAEICECCSVRGNINDLEKRIEAELE